jgi:hypothetical protein
MGIRPSNSLEKKNSGSISLLSSSFRHWNMSKQHSHNITMIKPTSPCNYNNSTGSSMADPFSLRGENITRKLTKTGHDTATIKSTLQQHNNPRLDPPCLSVLAQFLQRDERRLTSINMKVSNPIHNQRTVMASKHYKIGSSAQLVDDHNKISKLTIYTQNNSPLPGTQ